MGREHVSGGGHLSMENAKAGFWLFEPCVGATVDCITYASIT